MSQSARLIARRFEDWGCVPHVVREVFSDSSPAGVEAALDDFCRRELASGVERWEFFEASARLVALARPLARTAGLSETMMAVREGQLWPVPHDARFDFEATSDGAEWIDQIAVKARSVRDKAVGAIVVGHTDWRVQNMRFADGRLTAVYDWDSLSVVREPVLLGSVAHGFTANWALDDWRQFPSLSEALAFVADYEQGRGERFSVDERAVARASLAYTMAYTARCEHSDALTDMGRRRPRSPASPEVPAGTARAFLAEHATELLDVASSRPI